MAVTFSNPRLSTKECERMVAPCIFADNFVSERTVVENGGVEVGSGVVYDRGLTLDGGNTIVYNPQPAPSGIMSAVARFKTSGTDAGWIFGNDAAGTTGFRILISTAGIVSATHDTTDTSDELETESSYNDGEWHTVTYSIDTVAGTHTLYVDAESVTGVSATSGTIGIGRDLTPPWLVTCEFQMCRIFEAALTAENHNDYYLNQIDKMDALAVWRCDDICNDTAGDKIWDKTPELKDLYKGDRLTPSTFPTFDDDKYEFDGVDDYVSNFPDLPTTYTTSATVSENESTRPTVQTFNNSTTITAITTAGGYDGRLHNLQLFDRELTEIQEAHNRFQSLHYVGQILARGIFGDLSVEGTGQGIFFFGQSFRNWALIGGESVNSGTTQTGNGLTFPTAASNVTVDDEASLRFLDGSIVLYGDFSANQTGGVLIDKDGNYKLSYTSGQLDFNGSTIAHTFSNNTQIAVTWRNGYEPQFYVDTINIGAGSTTVTGDDTTTNGIVIGNNAATNSPSQYEINHVYLGDSALTHSEIIAMYNQSKVIIADPMEDPSTGSIYKDAIGSTDVYKDTIGAATIYKDSIL